MAVTDRGGRVVCIPWLRCFSLHHLALTFPFLPLVQAPGTAPGEPAILPSDDSLVVVDRCHVSTWSDGVLDIDKSKTTRQFKMTDINAIGGMFFLRSLSRAIRQTYCSKSTNIVSAQRAEGSFFLEWVTFGHQTEFSLVFSLAATSHFCLTLISATD